MVLWEITLGTAYFLGLKRTYRLALKIQRRLISSKHLKIRQFLHRRTRAVFDVALKVHRNIQERDIEVGRDVGNWILRWLDRMKPSAQIRNPQPKIPPIGVHSSMSMTKQANNSSFSKLPSTILRKESDRHYFTSCGKVWPKSFPTIAMMMRPQNTAGTTSQYRHLCISAPEIFRSYQTKGWSQGVVRKDIMQWMLQN